MQSIVQEFHEPMPGVLDPPRGHAEQRLGGAIQCRLSHQTIRFHGYHIKCHSMKTRTPTPEESHTPGGPLQAWGGCTSSSLLDWRRGIM